MPNMEDEPNMKRLMKLALAATLALGLAMPALSQGKAAQKTETKTDSKAKKEADAKAKKDAEAKKKADEKAKKEAAKKKSAPQKG